MFTHIIPMQVKAIQFRLWTLLTLSPSSGNIPIDIVEENNVQIQYSRWLGWRNTWTALVFIWIVSLFYRLRRYLKSTKEMKKWVQFKTIDSFWWWYSSWGGQNSKDQLCCQTTMFSLALEYSHDEDHRGDDPDECSNHAGLVIKLFITSAA